MGTNTIKALVLASLFAACKAPSGDLAPEERAKREAALAQARSEFEADPTSEEKIIWLGRRTAYLEDYEGAIEIYTRGIALHPESYRLLRHRGHRYITTRRFDLAVEDLRRAAALIEGVPNAVEPDGQPNPANVPTSTTHTSVFYHLGLAHYLRGEFDAAREAYRSCLAFTENDDMLCAASHWLYMTLRRLGREEDARAVLQPIRPEMTIHENGDYHRLLLMYKGLLRPEDLLGGGEDAVGKATVGYGVGNWFLYNGDAERARRVFESLLEGTNPAAFGRIAAEVDLARMRGR